MMWNGWARCGAPDGIQTSTVTVQSNNNLTRCVIGGTPARRRSDARGSQQCARMRRTTSYALSGWRPPCACRRCGLYAADAPPPSTNSFIFRVQCAPIRGRPWEGVAYHEEWEWHLPRIGPEGASLVMARTLGTGAGSLPTGATDRGDSARRAPKDSAQPGADAARRRRLTWKTTVVPAGPPREQR